MNKIKIKVDFPLIQTRLLPDEEKKVMECIHTARTLTMGPHLAELEENFAKFLGVKYAVGVDNCTHAIELAAMLLDLGPDDEVILPAHTFTASALPFLRTKTRLVFVDIDKETFVMSEESILDRITKRTKAIVPVHLYGLMAPMKMISEVARKNNIVVIEDVAQAPGALIDGKIAGSWGDFSCFSFHSQKNITALGEGGLIATNNSDAHEKILGLRKIGNRPYKNQDKYWIPAMSNVIEAVPGKIPYNFALAEPNACAANCILSRINDINETRRNQANRIKKGLSDFPELEFQKIPSGYIHAYHLLVARYRASHSERDDLIDILYNQYGIKCVVQYMPLYNYELFQRNGYNEHNCPKSDDFFKNMISFPFWSNMALDTMEYMIDSTRKAITCLRNKKK